jgi:hypothetical protein
MVELADSDRFPVGLAIAWVLFAGMLVGAQLYDRGYLETGVIIFALTALALTIGSLVAIISLIAFRLVAKH